MSRLTNKQRLFVEYYLANGLNAAEAARRAGYRGNDVTIRAVGAENLAKPLIRARINERLDQAAMEADEVLFRLSEQARAPDVTRFMEFKDIYDPEDLRLYREKLAARKEGDPETEKPLPTGAFLSVDLQKIGEMGLGHLIKKVKQTANGIEVEWHDPQRALELIGKYRKMFTNQVDVTSGGQPIKVVGLGIDTDEL